MTSENDTVADIAKRVRRDCSSYPLPTAAAEMLKLVREMDAAHQREVAELRIGIKELLDALQSIYNEECTSYGTYEIYDKWRKTLKGASKEVQNEDT